MNDETRPESAGEEIAAEESPQTRSAAADLWQVVCRALADTIDASDFTDFIATLRPVALSKRSLVVEAPSRLALQVILARYLRTLEDAIRAGSRGEITHVNLRVRPAKQQELFPPLRAAVESSAASLDSSNLSPKYTFRTFVVGAGNQFAHAACRVVARQPGKEQHNPLFLYGGVGLGKTHLVNAIGNHIVAYRPQARVLYLSAETFMNQLIQAIRRDRVAELSHRLRSVDVLILDDIQILSRKERTQEEFFHTFNALYHMGRQIVLTADKFPKDIPDLAERLRNRFEWGLIADIQPPDVETRVAILQRKAELERIQLPHEVALFVASNVNSNVRELEGALNRLAAFSSLNNAPITVDFAREVLRGILGEERDAVVSIDDVERLVCQRFHVRPRALRSKRRSRDVAQPRQVAMYLCRKYAGASFPAIGEHFGGRDHTTALHAVQVVEKRLQRDEELRQVVAELERTLKLRTGQTRRSAE